MYRDDSEWIIEDYSGLTQQELSRFSVRDPGLVDNIIKEIIALSIKHSPRYFGILAPTGSLMMIGVGAGVWPVSFFKETDVYSPQISAINALNSGEWSPHKFMFGNVLGGIQNRYLFPQSVVLDIVRYFVATRKLPKGVKWKRTS